MNPARFLLAGAGAALVLLGAVVTAAPEIGGMVTVGFVLFVSGVVLLANVVADALGVE